MEFSALEAPALWHGLWDLWGPWGDFSAWYSLLQPRPQGTMASVFPWESWGATEGCCCWAAAVPVDSYTWKKAMLLCSLSHTHLLGSLFHLTYFPGEEGANLLPQSSSLSIVIFCEWTTCLTHCLPVPQRHFSPTPFLPPPLADWPPFPNYISVMNLVNL